MCLNCDLSCPEDDLLSNIVYVWEPILVPHEGQITDTIAVLADVDFPKTEWESRLQPQGYKSCALSNMIQCDGYFVVDFRPSSLICCGRHSVIFP